MGPLLLILSAFQAPSQVILYIGDGVGVSHWTAAKLAADGLAVSRFKTIGLVDTRAADSDLTDSAAAATAYACAVRTFNGAIGVGRDSVAVPTILEIARDRGWATGLVATSSVTHATPASFAAHVPARAMEFEIARQMVVARVDVLLGGGRRWFDPAVRPDKLDLLGRLRGTHRLVRTAAELKAVDVTNVRRLAGLFAGNEMPPAGRRVPTLPEMTRTAVEILSRDAEGFFLMVEGSQPDWRSHDNDSLAAVVAEVLDFDRAIGVGLEYQRRHPNVLIVVVSDHETGGLAIEVRGAGRAARVVARYTTTGHTGEMIPLFASGPGADRFGGIQENWQIGKHLRELMVRPR
mgnify:CR=1 FL=1